MSRTPSQNAELRAMTLNLTPDAVHRRVAEPDSFAGDPATGSTLTSIWWRIAVDG